MNHNITFVIFTYNEERRIEFVLRCFKDFGYILLMDDGSTDKTIEIAQRYGAKIVRRLKCKIVEEEHIAQQIYDNVETPWIYWTFADEILPRILLERLVAISRDNSIECVNICRRNLHYGIEKLDFDSASQSPRFFRKGSIDFTGNTIHKMGRYIGRPNGILNLPMSNDYAIHHCSTYNVKKFEMAHSNYSDIEANELYENDIRASFKMLIIRPIYFFLRYYFLKGAWKQGYAGLIMVLQYCFFFFNTYAKLWEKQNNISLETIEQNYDIVKERLLK